MRPMPLITAAVVVVVLFLLVFQRDALQGADSGDAPTETTESAPDTPDAAKVDGAVGVVVLASKAREIDSAVILRGETAAMRSVELRAETSGKVASAPVKKGSKVAEGEVICALELGTQEAALAEAEARLAEAMTNLNAAEELSKGGYAAETRVLSARAAKQSAEAGVTAARNAMDDLRITAPFDGVLDGSVAEVGSLLQPGSLCATIVELDPIKLVGFVSEMEVSRVTLGADVMARTVDGRRVMGRVTFVARAADPVTRTFRVEAEVANADLSLRAGQTAEILVQSAGRKAHLLPQSSLTLSNEGALGVRLAGRDGRAEFAPVEMLRDTVEGVWVSGLPDEADVIVVGQDFVVAGVPLDVTYREAAQ